MATTTRQLADFIVEGGVQDIAVQQNPHIQPGTLQPAVAGKLLDGSTSHSGAYGTAQADGHKYYYTDIKGSKPIKDPRIGAHFGSQRHKIKSMQLLEQETATHGSNVYSVDGREWMRAVGNYNTFNDSHGQGIYSGNQQNFIEMVGYFSDINMLGVNHTITAILQGSVMYIDGSALYSGAEQNPFAAGIATPLGGRFVDRAALASIVTGQTLGIHTFKFLDHSAADVSYVFGFELIAQDTTSTATRSKIQIPAQNVVSYGKKFSVSAAAHHYDPFNGFTNGTSLHSAFVDTATSLGLDHAPGSSAKWAISNTNNIRPYNGGRVVKWIASDGTIKTSVNMMPPNAQNIGTTASNEITTPSATNTTETPNMSDDAIDHSLSEVAKTFNWREFGNGAANGGSSGTYKDASMMDNSTQVDTAFVMDDGLTGLYCNDSRASTDAINIQPNTNGAHYSYTFIGTGVTFNRSSAGDVARTVAQNLPYGTHIVKVSRDADSTPDITIDGITYADLAADNMTTGFFAYGITKEVTFHQPKKPPIPEDAVIISDYMLMADYVQNTANGNDKISKGVRVCSHTRDIFYDEIDSMVTSFYDGSAQPGMGYLASSSSGTNASNNKYSLPAFGTIHYVNGHTSQTKNDLFINDTDVAQSGTSSGNHGDISYPDAAVELGMNKFAVHGSGTQDYSPYISGTGWKIASPTHTSSHYQSFETPLLHELVGGDRNMEQTNLIVTPDGKSWDEVTRDTSYLGPSTVLHCFADDAGSSNATYVINTIHRGEGMNRFKTTTKQKNLVWAYDRMICLVDGYYKIMMSVHKASTGGHDCYMYKNGSETEGARIYCHGAYMSIGRGSFYWELKRGDYIQVKWSANASWAMQFQHFYAEKIG